MSTPIEETILENGLPVNTLCMLHRLEELIRRRGNCVKDQAGDPRIRACLWLINQQVFGQVATIDMGAEWGRCAAALEELKGIPPQPLRTMISDAAKATELYSEDELEAFAEQEKKK